MAPREHTLLNLAYKLAAVQVTDFHGNAGTPPTLYMVRDTEWQPRTVRDLLREIEASRVRIGGSHRGE
jgi:hypothetical protein